MLRHVAGWGVGAMKVMEVNLVDALCFWKVAKTRDGHWTTECRNIGLGVLVSESEDA